MLTFMTLILLISGIYIFSDWFSKITGFVLGEDENTRLAQCLDGKKVEFYSTTYCPDCEKQKEIFGLSFKFINHIDCGIDKSLCPNIRSVPAWYINETILYGFRNITELKELSGCVEQ